MSTRHQPIAWYDAEDGSGWECDTCADDWPCAAIRQSNRLRQASCPCLCHDLSGGPSHPGESCACKGGTGMDWLVAPAPRVC